MSPTAFERSFMPLEEPIVGGVGRPTAATRARNLAVSRASRNRAPGPGPVYPTFTPYLAGATPVPLVGMAGALQPPPVAPGVAPVLAVGGAAVLRLLLRALGGKFTLGMVRGWISKYGGTVVRTVLGAALFAVVFDALDGGLDDDTVFYKRRAPKRYTIGANPRLNTLLKVAKRVDNIFVKYESRMKKFRGRAAPRRHRHTPQPPYAALSPIELKALGSGR